MTTIGDVVHDRICVAGVGAALLETSPVHRPRSVTQVGTVHLVYPPANHADVNFRTGHDRVHGRVLPGRTTDHVPSTAFGDSVARSYRLRRGYRRLVSSAVRSDEARTVVMPRRSVDVGHRSTRHLD